MSHTSWPFANHIAHNSNLRLELVKSITQMQGKKSQVEFDEVLTVAVEPESRGAGTPAP
jgi:hypothetical protein